MALMLSGCRTVGPLNEAIRATPADVQLAAAEMREAPRPLDRPVVVLSGYRSPATNALRLARRVRLQTSGDKRDFLVVVYMFESDIHEIAARVVRLIEERWPSNDPEQTIEVDVLGISMGGLIARHAALAPDDRPGRMDGKPVAGFKRLNIRRLFTYGTPHLGAKLASKIRIDGASRAMQPGSPYITALNSKWDPQRFEVVPYAQLNDTWVGATRSAPPGAVALWDRGQPFFSHFLLPGNPLFIADTARRLRSEPPLIEAGSPPPMD